MNRLATRVLVALVQFYRLFFKAWLGASCRFEPSCSAYALEALARHGAVGSVLAASRLLRCRPGCEGGRDPAPDELPAWLGRGARFAPRRACACVSSFLLRGRRLPDVTP